MTISPREQRHRERLLKAQQQRKPLPEIEQVKKQAHQHPVKSEVVPILPQMEVKLEVPHVALEKIEVWNVTAIIVNRRTLDLTRLCFESLRANYPRLSVVMVDNWSCDESAEYVQSLGNEPNVVAVVNVGEEPHHAVGLNIGLQQVRTDFFLTLDSDVEVLRGGWLEHMLYFFKVYERMFAVGCLGMNANVDCTCPANSNERPRSYIHPFCALWDLKKFQTTGIQFQKTGMPTCLVCDKAQEMNYWLMSFPIDPHNYPVPYFIRHKWGGTRDTLAIQADAERKKKQRMTI